MNNKIILESLALDLKRVALGLQRGSTIMAQRFTNSALEREKEAKVDVVYMQKILSKVKKLLKSQDDERKAEDILMYSTLIQNFTQKRLTS